MEQCCKVRQYQPEELITLPCVGWMHYNPSACTAHTHSCTGLHYLGVIHRVPLLEWQNKLGTGCMSVCLPSDRGAPQNQGLFTLIISLEISFSQNFLYCLKNIYFLTKTVTYQTATATIFMTDSFKHWQKLTKGTPLFPILPNIIPANIGIWV